ncbi:MAG: DUF438 domain-containing protein [Candidatus Hodarchaeales archaeon]|jgi:DUF438 domain-containing protein
MSKIILTEATKILEVVNEYPILMDILIDLDPKLKRLQNPILRRTVGRKATLTDVAQMVNMDLDDLISHLSKELENKAMVTVDHKLDSKGKSGWKDIAIRKQDMLKALVLELHDGGDLPSLKARFNEILGDVEATEIAAMEQELINSGELTVEQITLLCDLHVGIFEDSLKEHIQPETQPGHPVHTYMAENQAARDIMAQLKDNPSPDLLKDLKQIITHYTRLENQLFPMLEKKDFAGPSQVMWAKHDEVRQLFREDDPKNIEEIISQVEDMIFKEESILYPTSLDLLTSLDWQAVKTGEEEIGFAWITPGEGWKPLTPEIIHQKELKPKVTESIDLDTGKLSLEQVNLLLTHLPIEISFINEKDEVRYYSDTKERIFPRSPGVIGRKVQKCHPPNSVDKVEQILTAFKEGKKDHADFWITMNEQFLHIRYFAVRDKSGKYKGTLEVMQNVTEIRQLEGEQRLVNWKE